MVSLLLPLLIIVSYKLRASETSPFRVFSRISILDTLLGKPNIKLIVSDLISSLLIEADWSKSERASLTDPPDTLAMI